MGVVVQEREAVQVQGRSLGSAGRGRGKGAIEYVASIPGA